MTKFSFHIHFKPMGNLVWSGATWLVAQVQQDFAMTHWHMFNLSFVRERESWFFNCVARYFRYCFA